VAAARRKFVQERLDGTILAGMVRNHNQGAVRRKRVKSRLQTAVELTLFVVHRNP